ncbi:ABC transporter permease, partial [Actinoallomurus acaciae]
MAPEAPVKTAPAPLTRLIRWDVIVTALLIVVFAGGAFGSSDFATSDNLSFALDDLSEIALIALPMTLLVVAAEVDLSVA